MNQPIKKKRNTHEERKESHHFLEIDSSLTPAQQREALRRAANGIYKLIDVALKRLLSDSFFSFAFQAEIALLQRDLRRMQEMVDYCCATDCLRSRILRYFGERASERCGHCGNCDKQFTLTDVTTEARMILSCVRRIEQRTYNSLGITLISENLQGSGRRYCMNKIRIAVIQALLLGPGEEHREHIWSELPLLAYR